MTSERKVFPPLQKVFLLFVCLGIILVTVGWVLVPSTSFLSLAGAYLILGIYGLVGSLGFSRVRPELLKWMAVFGLLAGATFAGEILLEYAVLPTDNTSWGAIEYGSVLTLFFLCGLLVSYQYKSIKSGVISSIMSAMLGSLVWLVFVLLFFYLFRGTARQELVFRAEGNYIDFANSGMADFNTFIMEDFFGAVFFHLLLSPLLAAILGTLGSLLGKGISHLKTNLTRSSNQSS